MNLEELRGKIDETDAEIVRLISERVKTAEAIGREKGEQGKQIEDKGRENTVLEHVKALADREHLNRKNIEVIYKEIINASKSVQGITVAYQGETGAYGEEAAFRYFGPSVRVKPCDSFDAVFKVVEQGQAHSGIVPIENSLEGSINQVYDLLLDSNLKVCGEIELRVAHCLIANTKAKLDSIKKVYSHPQALGQCRTFLRHLGCELIPTYDTAGSVRMIKEQQIAGGAAVASERAAEIYRMKIMAREIEDNQHNFTRFFILSHEDSPPSGNDKTSIVFSLRHRPGILYEFLKEFALNDLSLTKIESRPTRLKPWEYNFYLDFEGHRLDDSCRETLNRLEESALFIKILGSYPRAK